MRFRTGLVTLVMLFALAGSAMAAEVGFRVVSLATPGRSGTAEATVWYPTDANGKTVLVGDNGVFHGTPGQPDAPIAAGPFPLVLLSHGGFRAAPNTASWLAAGIAARGYVVAVVTPPPITEQTAPAAILSELWLRPGDLSTATTTLLRDPTLGRSIDPARIGAIGIFLGGYSVLELAGARTDAKRWQAICDGPSPGRDCAWFTQMKVDPHQAAAAELEQRRRDPRLKAIVIVDPELGSVLTPGSLRSLRLRVTIVNLAKYGAIPPDRNAATIADTIAGSEYSLIPDAAPFSSFPECKPKALAILAAEGGETAICEKDRGRQRAAIHATLLSTVLSALSRLKAGG